MRFWCSDRIESADFAFRNKVCIVISRAQGRPETGSAETPKFFLEKFIQRSTSRSEKIYFSERMHLRVEMQMNFGI